MALFRKTRDDPPPPPQAADGWTVSQGERDGRPLVLRYNDEAPAAGRSSLPVRFGVAVRFKKPRKDGLPNGGDFRALERIEDAIAASVEGGAGVLAIVVTTGGMREFVGYVREKEDVDPLWQSARAAAPGYEVQAYAKSDPAWELYEGFAPER